jgi:hypothetical protein
MNLQNALCQYLDLGGAHGATEGMNLTVDIRDAHLVEIDQRKRANPTTGEGFDHPGSYPSDTYHAHRGA